MKKFVSLLLLLVPVISNASAFLASLGTPADSQVYTSEQGVLKPKKKSKSLATVNSFLPNGSSTDAVDQKENVKVTGVAEGSSLKVDTKKSQSSKHLDSFVHNVSQSNTQQSIPKKQTQATEASDVSNSTDFLSSYYGNPKYKEAMNILDDSQLQTDYTKNLQAIEMKISDYAQQMIRSHHREPDKTKAQLEQEQSSKNIHSFLQGLQSSSQAQDSVVSDKVEKAKKKRSSNISGFLAGLKG